MDSVKDQQPTNHPRVIPLIPPDSSYIPLSTHLWFDRATCAIVRKGKRISLSAREARLLTALLNAPNHLHSAETLARLLTPPSAIEIDPHCVEQTICGLRRKLGESGRHPRLLVNRRGIGYGILPQNIAPTEQNSTSQPRQSQTRKHSKT